MDATANNPTSLSGSSRPPPSLRGSSRLTIEEDWKEQFRDLFPGLSEPRIFGGGIDALLRSPGSDWLPDPVPALATPPVAAADPTAAHLFNTICGILQAPDEAWVDHLMLARPELLTVIQQVLRLGTHDGDHNSGGGSGGDVGSDDGGGGGAGAFDADLRAEASPHPTASPTRLARGNPALGSPALARLAAARGHTTVSRLLAREQITPGSNGAEAPSPVFASPPLSSPPAAATAVQLIAPIAHLRSRALTPTPALPPAPPGGGLRPVATLQSAADTARMIEQAAEVAGLLASMRKLFPQTSKALFTSPPSLSPSTLPPIALSLLHRRVSRSLQAVQALKAAGHAAGGAMAKFTKDGDHNLARSLRLSNRVSGGEVRLDAVELGLGYAPFHQLMLYGALETRPSSTSPEALALYAVLETLSLLTDGNVLALEEAWDTYREAMAAVETAEATYRHKKVFDAWLTCLQQVAAADPSGATIYARHPISPLSSLPLDDVNDLRARTSFVDFCQLITTSAEQRDRDAHVGADELCCLLDGIERYVAASRALSTACRSSRSLNSMSSRAGDPSYIPCARAGCSGRSPAFSGVCTKCETATPNAWLCICGRIYNSSTPSCARDRSCRGSQSACAPPTLSDITAHLASIAGWRSARN